MFSDYNINVMKICSTKVITGKAKAFDAKISRMILVHIIWQEGGTKDATNNLGNTKHEDFF